MTSGDQMIHLLEGKQKSLRLSLLGSGKIIRVTLKVNSNNFLIIARKMFRSAKDIFNYKIETEFPINNLLHVNHILKFHSFYKIP